LGKRVIGLRSRPVQRLLKLNYNYSSSNSLISSEAIV
jgi:hypothetical protein